MVEACRCILTSRTWVYWGRLEKWQNASFPSRASKHLRPVSCPPALLLQQIPQQLPVHPPVPAHRSHRRSHPDHSIDSRLMKKKSFHMISLGCAKNMVDSASMAQILVTSGYQSTDQPSQARGLIVNTCGFIGPAKEESYEVLQELAAGKRDGQILIAAGCLTQRYGAEVVGQRAWDGGGVW